MNYLSISIYVLLIILLILSLILFFRLYSKIKSSDKNNLNLIEFPKETSLKIENFISENKKSNEELINYLNNQYKDAKSIIKEVDDKIQGAKNKYQVQSIQLLVDDQNIFSLNYNELDYDQKPTVNQTRENRFHRLNLGSFTKLYNLIKWTDKFKKVRKINLQ